MDQPVEVIPLASVDSTMKLARREIEAGRRTGPAFYVAAEQTAGVGSRGRAWESQAGGLWCTLAWPLTPGASPPKDAVVRGLGLRVGVAVLRVIGETLTHAGSGQAPMLKWPNDVLINGRKAAGTLCEVFAAPASMEWEAPVWWVLVGAGVNVNNDVGRLEGLRRLPIALRSCVKEEIDLDALGRAMLTALCAAVRQEGVPPDVLATARERLFRGRRLTLHAAAGYVAYGELVGLSDSGMPLVRSGDATFEIPSGSEFV